MRIALLAIHTLVCFIVQAQTPETVSREVILLNDREIAAETLLLVNPKKLKRFHIRYSSTGIKQYQIDAKIKFLQYDDLKVRLGLKIDDNPGVSVDGRSYPNKNDLEIDQSFVRSIDCLNGTIRVLTKRKKIKGSPCYGVRVTKTTLTANFPKPQVIPADQRLFN